MIETVGVAGGGLMGGGIAQATAAAGYRVLLLEVDDARLEAAIAGIGRRLAGAVAKGRIEEPARRESLARIGGTTRPEEFAACELVIEAISETLPAKRELLAALDGLCKPACIFASNTSSLSITELAAATRRRDRFVGLHFFNPVPAMKLVELVRTVDTSEATAATARAFGESLGKTVVAAADTPGFVVNRLLVPYLLDAIRALEAGVASREDIDAGMRLGCGHPMGPLALVDFVGLDTTHHVAEILFAEFKDPRYAAPPLLKRMVQAGYLGRKAGRGFYRYDEPAR